MNRDATHEYTYKCVHARIFGDKMVNMTISVPEDLKKMIDSHPEINWSEVARQAWKEKVAQLELLDRITAKSRATDKDVDELAAMLKKGIAKRHGN